MCAPDMPAAPDPQKQGAAQTSGNVTTAAANAALQNINEYTPQGNVIRKQTGTQQIWDENQGKTISVPTYSTYQSYSPQEQAIYNSGSANRLGANALAGTMIDQVGNVISKPIDYSNLPKAGSTANINLPKYTEFGAGPKLQTSIGNSGPITQNIANAGDIQGKINNNTRAATTFGQTGSKIQYDVPGANDFSKDRDKYQAALMARMNPQLAQSRKTLEQQLVNQGLQPGSEAYNRAADQASRQANDARFGAILNAGTEQQRMFDMALGAGNFHNAANAQDFGQQYQRGLFGQAGQAQNFGQDLSRGTFANDAQAQRFGQNAASAAFSNDATRQRYDELMGRAGLFNSNTQQMADNAYRQTAGNNTLQDQGFNAQSSLFGLQNTERGNALEELYQARSQPINEITALMSGGQVQQPNYAGANMPSLPNIDWAGLYQNNFDNKMTGYNAASANSNSLIGGAGSLFSSIIAASDIRLKENIVPVGIAHGHTVYEFDYRDPADGVGRHVGVMAQEVMQTRPDAVLRRADGMLMVDYGKLFMEGQT